MKFSGSCQALGASSAPCCSVGTAGVRRCCMYKSTHSLYSLYCVHAYNHVYISPLFEFLSGVNLTPIPILYTVYIIITIMCKKITFFNFPLLSSPSLSFKAAPPNNSTRNESKGQGFLCFSIMAATVTSESSSTMPAMRYAIE